MTKHNCCFPGVILLLVWLVSACAPTAENLESLSTATPTQMPSSTQQPTVTPTAMPSATPTPEIIFHAGIPPTIEDCNVLHPGTPVYEAEMVELDRVDRLALEALGGSTDFRPIFTVQSSKQLPAPFVDYDLTMSKILSCSRFEQDGELRLIFSIPTSRDTLMRIVYDPAAARDFTLAVTDESTWIDLYSFDTLFSMIAAGEGFNIASFGVFFYTESLGERPDSNFGFEGVWDFCDTPLDETLFLRLESSRVENPIVTRGELISASSFFESLDTESRQLLLLEMEKYIWMGSVLRHLR